MSLKDIAKETGVSIATVSYVLREKGHISAQTRLRVKEAVQRLGYRHPTYMKDVVALVTSSLDVTGLLPKAMYQAAAEQGFVLSPEICDVNEDEFRLTSSSSNIAGVVVLGGRWRYSFMEQVATRYPTVFLGATLSTVSSDAIWVDNSGIVEMAVCYLASLGHKRIGLLNGPTSSATSYEKSLGLTRAMARLRHPIESSVVDAQDFNDSGEQASLRLLDWRPTAVVAGEVGFVHSIMRACQRMTIEVPKDLSMIALRDHRSFANKRPEITAFVFPYMDIARSAIQHLTRRMLNPGIHGHRVLIQPKMMARQSVVSLAATAFNQDDE